jgi:Zn-dependent protease
MDFLIQAFGQLLLAQAGQGAMDEFIAVLVVLFLGIGIHEYCHAKFADMAGDPTPRIYGRVTLNLFNHFDPLGALMIVFMAYSGFGFGWGRPVPVDPNKMRNPRSDYFVSIAAGPLSNLLQAVIYGFVFRLGNVAGLFDGSPFLLLFLLLGIQVNLVLFFFNLIPLGPLDGSKIVGTMLPDKAADQWNLFQNRYGTMIFIGLLIFGFVSPNSPFRLIIGPLVEGAARLIMGL